LKRRRSNSGIKNRRAAAVPGCTAREQKQAFCAGIIIDI
jgi:hypothetical protein